jgi:hypothetical protein
MTKLIKRLLLFFSLIVIFIAVGVCLPGPDFKPRHFLYAKNTKDSMLAAVPEPRIILLGGSNLSLGINSREMEDSLHRRPINTGTHAALGLIYMMDNTARFIKEGDIIVVSPEYDQFYGDFAYGGYELLVTTFDVDRSSLGLLSAKQWMNLYAYIPKYAITKLNPMKYRKEKHSILYYENSFNEYGDVTLHWNWPGRVVLPLEINGDLNQSVFEALKTFEGEVTKKKAKMFVTFPGFQESSYKHNLNKVKEVEATLRKMNFDILGTAAEYKINDSLMFDTPYHLRGTATEYRTKRLISELREKLK